MYWMNKNEFYASPDYTPSDSDDRVISDWVTNGNVHLSNDITLKDTDITIITFKAQVSEVSGADSVDLTFNVALDVDPSDYDSPAVVTPISDGWHVDTLQASESRTIVGVFHHIGDWNTFDITMEIDYPADGVGGISIGSPLIYAMLLHSIIAKT